MMRVRLNAGRNWMVQSQRGAHRPLQDLMVRKGWARVDGHDITFTREGERAVAALSTEVDHG